MKVLLVCKKFPYPPKDGETIAIFNHIKGYHKAGHQVTVAAINTSKHHTDVKSLPEAVLKLAQFHSVDIDTALRPVAAFINLFQNTSYHIARFVAKSFEEKLENILTENKFDVIQLEGLYVAPYLSVVRKQSKALVAMRPHNIEHEIWERMADHLAPGLKKWYLKLQAARLKKYEIGMLNKYDVIVPITARDGALFEQFGCKLPMFISPAGVDLEEYRIDASKPEFPSVFFLGGLDWLPNQDGLKWFIEKVWRRVAQANNHVKFFIAGRNAPPWINNLDENGVEAIGEVDDAKAFMNSKSIMVVPLFSGSGMRIKIIEGMAMGKTILSTGLGAEGIDYSAGENIIIADTAEEFYREIIKCIDNREYAAAIGKNASGFARAHFNNDKQVNSLMKFYSETIAG